VLLAELVLEQQISALAMAGEVHDVRAQLLYPVQVGDLGGWPELHVQAAGVVEIQDEAVGAFGLHGGQVAGAGAEDQHTQRAGAGDRRRTRLYGFLLDRSRGWGLIRLALDGERRHEPVPLVGRQEGRCLREPPGHQVGQLAHGPVVLLTVRVAAQQLVQAVLGVRREGAGGQGRSAGQAVRRVRPAPADQDAGGGVRAGWQGAAVEAAVE
jgi:hypothetical protein